MKIKWNWGTGIVVAMILFMVFILQFVYRVTFVKKYDHNLVTEDYYKEELHYQEEIDKMNNASKLPENIVIKRAASGVDIIFPSGMEPDKITGKIYFKRLSNNKLDFEREIKLDSLVFHIPEGQFIEGHWEVKIDWKYNDKPYMLKEDFYY